MTEKSDWKILLNSSNVEEIRLDLLTVFTPVYNRRYTMERLYESLRRQSNHNFEWLIVDDGSTDYLEKDVQMWMRENTLFPIRYRYVKNGGKHRAINLAAQIAKGESVFIVDSDDYLAPHAIGFIEEKFSLIEKDETFAGMAFPYYVYTENKRIGEFPISGGYIDSTLNRVELGIKGDVCMLLKRKILKAYRFPEYEGENFMAEGAAWDLIGPDGYKIRFYDEKLYFAEYLKDGLTRNGVDKLVRNPRGWAASIRARKRWKDPNIYKAQYFYYACMHKKFDKNEICRLLEIEIELYKEYEAKWKQFISRVQGLLDSHTISSIALYGFGMNARYFLVHLQEIGRDIVYGIDRKAEYVNYEPVYDLEMKLPKVDCVFITSGNLLTNDIENIKGIIKRKLPETLVWSLREIDESIW